MKHTYFVIILLVLVGCGKRESKSDMSAASDTTATEQQVVELSKQQLSSAGIEIGTPHLENISSTITLQGIIEVPPGNKVNLSFPVGGYIKSTSILPGSKVKKGEMLAMIEDMQFIQLQQDYLMAKTNLELATREFQRQEILNATMASSDKVLQEAKAEMERQKIMMSSFAEKLKLIGIAFEELDPASISKALPIRSPIDGFVSKVNISLGKYTSPTDVLFELIDPSDIHLSLKVYEKDISKIAIGSKVHVFSNSRPDRMYTARVGLINRAFDENRSTEIHCHFEKRDAGLIPGMFINARVAVDDLETMVVPEGAVVRWANRHYVFVAGADGQFIMTEVAPGIVNGGKQQISSDQITVGTNLVVRNAFALLMKIKNVEKEG